MQRAWGEVRSVGVNELPLISSPARFTARSGFLFAGLVFFDSSPPLSSVLRDESSDAFEVLASLRQQRSEDRPNM
jgi:hypothetical protein